MDIITVHMHGEEDSSPLEMISAARLAYLQRVEAAARGLVAALGSLDGAGSLMSGPRPERFHPNGNARKN